MDDNIEELGFDPFAGAAIALAIQSTEPQRELWTATRFGTDASLAFNESVSLDFRGTLNADALRDAVQALVDRHEALRSSFSEDGTTVLVHEAPALNLVLHDFAALDASERAARLEILLSRVVEEPFDLTSPSLVRFDLVALAPEEHVLVITAHHIVCDGWSFAVIASDLAALYSSFLRGKPPSLPPADRFSEYASSLDVEGSSEFEAAERYWLKQFAGEPPVLDLPSDRGRPPLKTYRAKREDWIISEPVFHGLKEAAKRKNASLFATLLAAFSVLMHRLSGQDDLVVGIPVAGQAATGYNRLVGHCVNMLPLRIRLASGMSFSDLLAQARTTMLDALDNQQITLGSLLRRLPIVRDPSRLPLVSVILNVDRRLGPESMPFEGLAADMRGNPRHFETFDVFVNAVETESALVLECQYNTDLYDRATIRRWLASYERLLVSILGDLDADIEQIAILSPADFEAIALCNSGATAPPVPGTIHGLIEAQVGRSRNAVAIECEGRSITYAELDARANQLARYLRSRGVQHDVLVGLCMTRSIEMVVGLVAILKAGGGYLPLDPDYPKARLQFMVADSGMRALLTEEKLRASLDVDILHVVSTDRDADVIARQSPAPLAEEESHNVAESTAYIIYTSGSTGKPKGVVVPHRSVVNLLKSAGKKLGFSDRDVVLAITTLSFDIAVSELLLPLTVGARIVLATREVATDGIRLSALIEDTGVTFVDATPATYRLLIAAGWLGAPCLRLVCTGESMPLDLAEALIGRAGDVWNAYGPTETTVWATMYRLSPPVEAILIGRPIANTVAHVLDKNMRQVPVGVRGELFVGGAAVANGYLNRPDLTAERFLPDAIASDSGARMYKTGDVVRLLADGNLECLGRTDNQVKVRGFRIELGEIENVLLHHAGLTEAAVTVREDNAGDARLVAYLVGKGRADVSDGDLRAFVRQTLPDHMVPHAFVWVDAMPLTPSGKIDRKALNAVIMANREATDFIEPRTDTELILAELWKEALGIGRVSIRDDFFALGGHSLLASQLLSRLRQDHGMEVSFRKIFEAPTIEQLAAVLDASVSGKEPSARISPIPHITGTESGPVSILQERLWLLEELDPAQSLTHMHPAAWDLRGALDTEIAKKALHDFVERHEIMRTSFHLSEGVRTQTVAGESVIPVSLVDLSELSEAERQRALTDHFQSQLSEAFDLGRAPLVRISLIRCGPDDTVLHTVHHGMVWDGWSFDIFIREFAENYSARVSGQSPALSQLPITYADFARWQREWMLGAEAAEQAKWWREQLEGVPDGLELPTDRPRVAHSLHRGGRVTLKFSAEEVELLKAMARKHDATMFMLVFAAYNVLLHRYTGQKDLVVGTPVRSRTRSETEDVVGPFVNTVAMRSRIDPAMQFADFLRNVREVTLESLERQELPFELLGTTPPALRVLFSMQDARERPSRIGELSIEQLHVPEHSASNDLMLWTMEYQSHLLAALNYSSELFDHGTAERFLRQLRTLLLAALEDPTQSIATINILPDEELAAVLGTDRETPDNEFVHSYEQIADWASRAPSAIALISNGESLSYGALMERTAKAAESLRAVSLANGPELAIAIGSDTVVGMLAAMRSGGAIMLIDPDDPAIYRAKLLTEPRVSALIVDEEKRDELSVDGIPTVVVASTAGLFETRPADAATDDVALSFADLAAITHHPGPTGEPLKSSLSERALTTLLDDLRMLLSVSSEDVTVSCVRSGTDTALIEILLPLTSGATLIIAPDDVLSSGDRLAALLGQVGATLMIAPLSIWRSLAAADWNGGPTFRAVITGPPHVSSELSSLSGRAGKVFTAYGYPEIGIWSAVHEVSAVEFHPILGTPVGGARFFVLDDLRAPTPIGVPGDLYVEAPFFSKDASGSMDPPARIVDAQRISPVKLFRTGDRARRMADGTVRYVSGDPTRARVDGPVVEFSAVERALLSHPSIVSAAVTCMRDLTGVPRLVAYVMRTPGADYTDTELRAKVRKVLPGTMIPNVIVELDALPTDGAGKLDRLSLPSPFADESQSRAFVPPRTEQERVLAEAWVAALGIERVDVRDNFFMRGGSSLLCFRVIETLQREHGIRLSPRALLLGTLEQAAAQIELGQRSAQSGASAGPMLTAPGALQKLKALIQGVK